MYRILRPICSLARARGVRRESGGISSIGSIITVGARRPRLINLLTHTYLLKSIRFATGVLDSYGLLNVSRVCHLPNDLEIFAYVSKQLLITDFNTLL